MVDGWPSGKKNNDEGFGAAVVFVSVNSLRRHLKLSYLKLLVLSLQFLGHCVFPWTVSPVLWGRGPGCRDYAPEWHISLRQPGDREKEGEQKQVIRQLANLHHHHQWPWWGIFTHTELSCHSSQGLRVILIPSTRLVMQNSTDLWLRENWDTVTLKRGKQNSGTSPEAACDRALFGNQPRVLFQAVMMSLQRESLWPRGWTQTEDISAREPQPGKVEFCSCHAFIQENSIQWRNGNHSCRG